MTLANGVYNKFSLIKLTSKLKWKTLTTSSNNSVTLPDEFIELSIKVKLVGAEGLFKFHILFDELSDSYQQFISGFHYSSTSMGCCSISISKSEIRGSFSSIDGTSVSIEKIDTRYR